MTLLNSALRGSTGGLSWLSGEPWTAAGPPTTAYNRTENASCTVTGFKRVAARRDKLTANVPSAVARTTLAAFWM